MPNYELNMPRITITVTRAQAEMLEGYAKQSGKKISAIVREALELLTRSESTTVITPTE